MKEVIIKLSEDEIREIIAEKYGVRKDMVTIHADYRFVMSPKLGDKVRENFVYSLVDRFVDEDSKNDK